VLCLHVNEQTLALAEHVAAFKAVDEEDSISANLYDRWPACVDFVRSAMGRGGKVLIHCDSGVSRSGATAVACLMAVAGHSLAESLRLVRAVRPPVNPNPAFLGQLMWWSISLGLGDGARALRGTADGVGLADEVRPGVWLGGIAAAYDRAWMGDAGITAVLSCGRGLTPLRLPPGVEQLQSVRCLFSL
jgi:hypothetical protein